MKCEECLTWLRFQLVFEHAPRSQDRDQVFMRQSMALDRLASHFSNKTRTRIIWHRQQQHHTFRWLLRMAMMALGVLGCPSPLACTRTASASQSGHWVHKKLMLLQCCSRNPPQQLDNPGPRQWYQKLTSSIISRHSLCVQNVWRLLFSLPKLSQGFNVIALGSMASAAMVDSSSNAISG